jgi:predicted RNase H-related nuclease YkuK (DUF458 family)
MRPRRNCDSLNVMRTPQNTDIRWIVAGAAAILTAGMLIVTFISTRPGDTTATITAVVSMVTLGVGGVFGLSKLNETQSKRVEGVSEKIAENTQLTQEIGHQLNGGLDARMKACAEQAILDAMPAFRRTMTELLDEYTRPR